MRDNIFSSVVFPAPFRPISPSTSPSRTSNDTFFSAQNTSCFGRRSPASGARAKFVSASRSVPRISAIPRRYCFPNPSARITAVLIVYRPPSHPVLLLYAVCNRALDPLEKEQPTHQHHGDHSRRGHHLRTRRLPMSSQRPAEPINHPCHRV